MTESSEISDARFAAFSHRPFAYYWGARFLANFSVQIMSVAVGWQIYAMTGNPYDLGIIGLVQFLPLLLLVLVTGAVADRFGRRKVMLVSSVAEVACAIAILVYTLSEPTSPIPVFVILAFLGIARAFYGPASQSLVVNLVPAKDFANAVAWNTSAWQTATIVGPVAGGLLYGVSAATAYSVSLVLLLASTVLVAMIPKPQARTARAPVTFSSLLDGIRFIRTERIVLGAISLDLFAVLLGGVVALLPIYAKDILELGPWGLGMLRAAPGVGAILMAAFLTARPIRDNAGIILFAAVALFGLFTVMFAVSTLAWLSIGALALIGAADMISVYVREVLLQLWTPDEVRGRVNAVNMVFLGASNELGEFRAGFMAGMIGVVPAAVFGGVGSVIVAIAWAWYFPELRKARYLDRGR